MALRAGARALAYGVSLYRLPGLGARYSSGRRPSLADAVGRPLRNPGPYTHTLYTRNEHDWRGKRKRGWKRKRKRERREGRENLLRTSASAIVRWLVIKGSVTSLRARANSRASGRLVGDKVGSSGE